MRLAINGKPLSPSEWPFLKALFRFLYEERIDYTVKRSFALAAGHAGIPFDNKRVFLDETEMGDIDMLISIGGDGTLLESVTLIAPKEIPIFCVNAGRLGFLSTSQLADVVPNLTKVLQGDCYTDNRNLVSLDTPYHLFGGKAYGLNEFSITKADQSSMIVVHAFVNDRFLNTYWADGLILSTPTGSTGYSLSCGGPILLPDCGNMVLTAVSPHNLTTRPVVIPDDAQLRFVPEVRDGKYLLSLDSRTEVMEHSLQISARKASFEVQLLRLQDNNFIDTIRNKLGWGKDYRN